MRTNKTRYFVAAAAILFLNTFIYAQYNPLTKQNAGPAKTIDLTVQDNARKRGIPIRVYLPANVKNAPVILFSHGLGGSREGGRYLGEHWSARGYVAVFLQHPGSDESVWKSAGPLKRIAALKSAANTENFLLRVKDVSVVLDQLEIWNKTKGNILEGMIDMKRIGMSGHSFGAITTQAVTGQTAGAANLNYTDPRIKAAVILSPSSPVNKAAPKEAFKNVKIPWLLMTGTKDIAAIGNINVESRLAVFPALPPGNKYELVLYNAEHSAFTDRLLPGENGKRNPNHHKVIIALSTAFWDAYLKNDTAAKTWLDSGAPNLLLEPKDRWQKK
jgi:predicted dienelactone hydrolase